MKLQDFQQIETKKDGIYRLVPEDQLEAMINKTIHQTSLFQLFHTYGTLLRAFRGIKNLNQSELAERATVERKALYLLEEDRTTKPKSETHKRLVDVLGLEFDQIARLLRLIE